MSASGGRAHLFQRQQRGKWKEGDGGHCGAHIRSRFRRQLWKGGFLYDRRTVYQLVNVGPSRRLSLAALVWSTAQVGVYRTRHNFRMTGTNITYTTNLEHVGDMIDREKTSELREIRLARKAQNRAQKGA